MQAGSPHPDDSPDEAISHLVAAHGDRLYTLGLKFCGDHEEAQDLVQETFLQAYKGWPQFEGRSAPATWLYTISASTDPLLPRRPHRAQHLLSTLVPADFTHEQAAILRISWKSTPSRRHTLAPPRLTPAWLRSLTPNSPADRAKPNHASACACA